jgi:prophage tail gpP-like protein
LGQKRALWECNRRYGRSQIAKITVDSWRDGLGDLWQINSLVDCNIPVGKLGSQELLIASVSFRKDLTSGTTCDLILMPKEAFSIEPTTLTTFDADKQNALNLANSPSPPNYSGES